MMMMMMILLLLIPLLFGSILLQIRYQLAILEGEAAAADMGFGEEDANEKLVELMLTNNDKDQDGRLSRSEYLGVIYRDGEL